MKRVLVALAATVIALGAPPAELFLEQVRRFGRDVVPILQKHQVTKVPEHGA